MRVLRALQDRMRRALACRARLDVVCADLGSTPLRLVRTARTHAQLAFMASFRRTHPPPFAKLALLVASPLCLDPVCVLPATLVPTRSKRKVGAEKHVTGWTYQEAITMLEPLQLASRFVLVVLVLVLFRGLLCLFPLVIDTVCNKGSRFDRLLKQ